MVPFTLIIVTGITNLLLRGYGVSDLINLGFWKSNFGHLLLVKLHLFTVILIISWIHDFYAGEKADYAREMAAKIAVSFSARLEMSGKLESGNNNHP